MSNSNEDNEKNQNQSSYSTSNCFPSNYGGCLPEDMITQILLRLPVKSLLRFKSVCKNWYSQITDSKFAKSQYEQSSMHQLSSSHLIIRADDMMFTLHLDLSDIHDKNTPEIKGKFQPVCSKLIKAIYEKRSFYVLGSCNGILCIRVHGTKFFYLWNPTTNDYCTISVPYSGFDSWDILLFGFGYASTIDDYKIVLVVWSKDSKPAYIYSSRENKWKKIDNVLSFPLPSYSYSTRREYYKIMEAVISNDALHWVVGCYDYVVIVKFDMVNDTFSMVEDLRKVHRSDKEENRYLEATEIGVTRDNNLFICQQYNESCLCYYCPKRKPNVVEMRVLNARRDTWKKKFRIEGRWSNIGDNHELLRISDDGKVLIFMGRYRTMEHLLIFCVREGKGFFVNANCEYCAPYKSGESVIRVVNYVQTLISPNSIRPMD